MRYRFLFGWGGGLAILMLAYGMFFSGPRGVADPAGYGAGWCCGRCGRARTWGSSGG